ncbi:hypothetical protein H6P81_016092 [Aristolochia fimbriata]|uniref:Aminotransferase-like plant mobile domain-containing protein n=1 Tax=Aristolochia fimbriata TaxID=158543 RepID=A0AAV7EAI9_ARIFI|nr:hypothetical protein H6P81_016092 [Aristolochia fimbriata]
MALLQVALIGGLRAFDHTVIVGDETVQTLALYKEDDASHLTYCPSGESIFGGHAVNYPSPVDRSLPYGSLSRFLATGDHIFFLPCPGSSEDEAVAAGSGSLALQSALLVANRPPRTLQDRFMDREVIPTLPDAPMDAPIPFLYEWTTLLLGRCCRTLRDAGIYHGLWASIFQYNCDVSVRQTHWSPAKANSPLRYWIWTGFLDCLYLGHFYDEVSPTRADFTDVRSSALPYSCAAVCFGLITIYVGARVQRYICPFAWVEVLVPRREDNVVPVNDPWTAWYASYGKDMPPPREFSTTERDVFDFLRVTPGKEDEVHLAALLSVWLSRFVFRSTHDDIRPMVFKVASYMATGVRFALAGPTLACLYKGLGQAVAGWPSIVPWPYLYSWLAVYFHTHGEDLGGAHRPGMVAFGNPSLRRNFDEDQAHNLFRRLPVLVWNRYALGWNSVSALVDEPKLKRPLPKAAYESLLSVRCCFLTARRSLRYFIEPYNPTRFARQFGYCQDLPGEFKTNRREVTSLSELMNLWRASVIRPCGRLDLPLPGEPTRDPGVTLAYYNWWKEHMSPHFEVNPLGLLPAVSAVGDSEEDEDYDSDRSHPRKRRPKGRKQVVASSVKKKRAPLTVLNDASTSMKKKPRKEVPLVSFPPSPPTFLPSIPEIEPPTSSSARAPSSRDCSDFVFLGKHRSSSEKSCRGYRGVEEPPAEIAPILTQPEALPISREEAPTPVIEAPAIEAGIEVVQEEVPIEEVFETVLAPEEVALEVVPSEPAVEGAPIVQNSAILPTSSSLTSSQTPSQQLLSYVEGLMLQAWKDKIAPRMVSPGAVRDGPLLADAEFIVGRLQEVSHDVTSPAGFTLKSCRSLARWRVQLERRQVAFPGIGGVWSCWESLGILSSKLEDAEITLSEVAEELSEAKDDEEDARERLELAKEQLQSAETKVVYLTTQAEQIQESVRDLKKAVVAAEQMVAEIIARPTLSATEEAALLSLRADFAEAQQEIAKDL